VPPEYNLLKGFNPKWPNSVVIGRRVMPGLKTLPSVGSTPDALIAPEKEHPPVDSRIISISSPQSNHRYPAGGKVGLKWSVDSPVAIQRATAYVNDEAVAAARPTADKPNEISGTGAADCKTGPNLLRVNIELADGRSVEKLVVFHGDGDQTPPSGFADALPGRQPQLAGDDTPADGNVVDVGRGGLVDAMRALRMSVQLELEDLALDIDKDGRVTAEDSRRIFQINFQESREH
jgi:hypothetical protein